MKLFLKIILITAIIKISIKGARSTPPKFGRKDLMGLYNGSKILFREFQICITTGWLEFNTPKFSNQLIITWANKIYQTKSKIKNIICINDDKITSKKLPN